MIMGKYVTSVEINLYYVLNVDGVVEKTVKNVERRTEMKELANKQEVYTMLDGLGGCNAEKGSWEHDWNEVIGTAINLLTVLPTSTGKYDEKWIPLEKQMPTLGECIIVTVRDHYREQLELRYPVWYMKEAYTGNETFYFGEIGNMLLPEVSEILAWMPMPKVYDVKI